MRRRSEFTTQVLFRGGVPADRHHLSLIRSFYIEAIAQQTPSTTRFLRTRVAPSPHIHHEDDVFRVAPR